MMKITYDIRDVFVYSDYYFYDLNSDVSHEYSDFLHEIDAPFTPKLMYQSSFLHERLIQSSIVRGITLKVKQAAMLIPYRFSDNRKREIAAINIHLKCDNMIYSSVAAGLDEMEKPTLLVTDFGGEYEFLLYDKEMVVLSEYHDKFSEDLLIRFSEKCSEKMGMDDIYKVCVSAGMLSLNFHKHMTLKELCENAKNKFNELGESDVK